ncbi:hypothetical protein D3C78_1534480 [compost metagenome]
MAAALDVQRAFAGDLQADRQAVRVGATDAAIAFDKARVVGDALAVEGKVRLACDTPHHFTHGRTGLDGRRQAGFVEGGQHHAAAIEGFEDHLVRLFADFAQAPVGEEADAGGEVFHAIGDFVDAQYAHCPASTPAQASGCWFMPQ